MKIQTIRKCKECNCEFLTKTGKQTFCSRRCLDRNKGRRNDAKRRNRPPGGSNKYKRYKKDFCQFCGFIPVDTCQLDVDHIDGNHKNNNPINLQTLCANCHRLKTKLNKEGMYGKREN